MERPEIREKLRSRFGAGVFLPDGSVDRRAVAALVFGPSDEHRQARLDLESIVHPAIVQHFQERIEVSRRDPRIRAILLDAAVLLESGWRSLCDSVIYVDVPETLRLSRVQSNRGWPESEFRRREQSQWPVEKKRAASDAVIDNSKSPESAAEALRAVIERILASRTSHPAET